MKSVSAKAGYALIAPYFALIICLLIVPSIGVIDASLRKFSPAGITGGAYTFDNYLKIGSKFEIGIIFQTIKLSALSTVVAAILGYPVAYLLGRTRGLSRTMLSLLVMIPFMTSIVVKVLGWLIILGPHGFVAVTLRYLGFGNVPLLFNQYAVLISLCAFAMPLMIFSLAAAIERIPVALEEAATNLGCGAGGVFFRVVLPLSWAGLLSGCLLCFSTSASAYVAPAVLGGRFVRMAGQQVYDQVMVVFNWPGGAALSVVLILLLGTIVYSALSSKRSARPT